MMMEMDGVRQIGRPRNTMGSRAKDNAKSFVLSNRYGTVEKEIKGHPANPGSPG